MEERLKHVGTFKDEDGTVKAVYDAKNGVLEMTFLVNKQERGIDVFCVPTHHYCSLGCTFCHLTSGGAPKTMIPIEKDDLIEAITRTSYRGCKLSSSRENRRSFRQTSGGFFLSNWAIISFMGAGEPMLNLGLIESVFENEESIKKRFMYEKVSYALASMMPNRNLEKLSKYAFRTGMPLKVHFSMHSPFDDERQKIVPKAGPSIEEVLSIMDSYRANVTMVDKARKNLIEFHGTEDPTEIHYTLIKDVNDTPRHLEKFVELADKYSIPVKFLKFNPVDGMQVSERANEWIESIKKNVSGLKVREYDSPGKNIGSSCGAFAKHFYLPWLETEQEKIKFEKWKEKYETFEK